MFARETTTKYYIILLNSIVSSLSVIKSECKIIGFHVWNHCEHDEREKRKVQIVFKYRSCIYYTINFVEKFPL